MHNKNKNILFPIIIIFTMFINITVYSDIIYTTDINTKNGLSQIYICTNQGTNSKLLTNPDDNKDYINPDYSNSLNKIIFKSHSIKEGHKIETMDPNGKNIKTVIYDKKGYCDEPRFSPNGKEFVYVNSYNKHNYNEYNIHVYNFKEKKSTKLTKIGYCSSPSWSTDGKKIVFISNSEIYTIDKTGANLTKLTDDGLIKLNPIFLLKNKYIYYSAHTNLDEYGMRRIHLYALNIREKKTKRINGLKGNYYSFIHINNNMLIASGETQEGNFGIYLINIKALTEALILNIQSRVGKAVYVNEDLLKTKK